MTHFTLTPSQKKYVRTALNSVARTFAMLPPFLDAQLADIMSVAYLICRVIDNIEDCENSFDFKQVRFEEVRHLLQHPADYPKILKIWSRLEWQGLNQEELALMRTCDQVKDGGAELWQIYATLPAVYQSIIGRWATEMAIGMEGTLSPDAAPHVIGIGQLSILCEPEDYNRYCYYVAGTVGYLQTELLDAFYEFSDDVIGRLRKYSLSFGLGLQKTNIVKDFLDDLNRGMCYLPYSWMNEIQNAPLKTEGAHPIWVRNVLFDVKGVLDEAVEYISALPYKAGGVRQATLMCLLPAYQTILLAAEKSGVLFTPKHHVKISKACLAKCMIDAKRLASNNQLLAQYRDNINQSFEKIYPADLGHDAYQLQAGSLLTSS